MNIRLLPFLLLISVPQYLVAKGGAESLASNLAVRFALNRLFGTNPCTAESFAKVTFDAGRMAIAENFALLDGNVRIELGSSQFTNARLSQVDAYQYGLDKVTIDRPDLLLRYTIFPQLKAYLIARAPTNNAASIDIATVRMEERGEEELEGHACVKRLAVITSASGNKQEFLFWFAPDLKNFPIRIQFKEGNQLETITYRNVQFARSDRSLFEPPHDFTLCRDMKEVRKRLEKMELGALAITNRTYGVEDEMLTLIKFTLRSGSNRPIGSNTASAFGLGSGPIPSKQIAFGSKDSPLVSLFGISQVNSNDLFFAQVDQNTRTGTVWLTSPSGKLRGAILTSTNGAPKTLATEGQEESYQELRAEFFSASEPPP